MVNFEPLNTRERCFSVSDMGGSEEIFQILPIRSRPYDPLVTCPDALPLSYRGPEGAKATKLGSCDKHPAYC